MIRFFRIYILYFFCEKIVWAKRVFPSLCRDFLIRLYYVSVGSPPCVRVVYFASNTNKESPVREKEIKNSMGNIGRQAFVNEEYEKANQTKLEWFCLIGWVLAVFFACSTLELIHWIHQMRSQLGLPKTSFF